MAKILSHDFATYYFALYSIPMAHHIICSVLVSGGVLLVNRE